MSLKKSRLRNISYYENDKSFKYVRETLKLLPQIYDGNYPYADGKKGEYREKTVPVKSLPPNPWGLYEMHGNVWEWCADTWKKNLGEGAVADPYNDTNNSLRVVRGGSWIFSGRYVRSAYRNHVSPDVRPRSGGFRLASGHKLRPHGSAKQGKGAGTSSQDKERTE
jgi:formylglycine-generating enzyme required for sulfatase activity